MEIKENTPLKSVTHLKPGWDIKRMIHRLNLGIPGWLGWTVDCRLKTHESNTKHSNSVKIPENTLNMLFLEATKTDAGMPSLSN